MHLQFHPWVDSITARHEFTEKVVPAVWIILSVHMMFIAFLVFGLSFYKSRAGAAILIAFGLWLWVDAVIVFSAVGAIIPVYMFGVAGICYLAAGLMLRRSMKT